MKRLATLGVALSSLVLMAHSWYPWECCHEMDCSEATNVEYKDEGWLITTKYGTTLFPKNFPIRGSKDTNIHACMLPTYGDTDEKGKPKMRPLCLFFPGQS